MKDYKDDKFNEMIGDRLRSFSEEPPVGMFERIEQTLSVMVPEAEQTTRQTEKAMPIPLWRRPLLRGVAAAMVAAMFALVVVVALRDNAPEEMKVVAHQAEQPLSQQPSFEQSSEGVEQTERVEMVAMSVSKPIEAPRLATLKMDSEVILSEAQGEESVAEQQDYKEPKATATSEKRERKSRKSSRRSSSRQNQQELEEYWRNALSEQPRQRGLAHPTEVCIYAANAGFNKGHIERSNVANSAMLVTEQNEMTADGTYIAPTLVNRDNGSNLEHYMPITVGITLSYSLNDWLSMESGLLYTNLYSTSDSSGALSHYGRHRTMDYIGVPLAISASFADFDRLSLYGRLGTTAEFCINANDKTYMDGAFVEKWALDVPLMTFSLDAAVGANYALWGGIGLFGEVGCTYWNVPEGYVENYRTVHPLSLSTRFGLRFTFN